MVVVFYAESNVDDSSVGYKRDDARVDFGRDERE